MKSRFERFVQMAKEDFGLTVTRANEGEKQSFESLFGALPEDIAEYELPYNTMSEQTSYLFDGLIADELLIVGAQSNEFDVSNILVLAA